MKLTKYDSYKESGVEWLGEIPSHWEIRRLKEFFCQISETGDVLEEGTYVPLENIESFTGRLIKKSSNENGEITSLFKKGDLLFNKLRPYLGKVIECQFDGGASGEAIVLRVKNSLNSKVCLRYFFYRLLSSKFIFQANSLTTGVKMPRTNPNIILALDICYTSKKEQLKITNFLDKKTSQIDRKIELLQEKKVSYKELKKSLINETVCRGLDKDVELKDSGIEWIGKIPKHWKFERLKEQFSLISSGIYSFKEKKEYLSTKSISINKIEKIEEIITFKKRPSRANMQPIINSVWFAKLRFTKKSYLFDDLGETKKYILSTGFAGLRTKSINSKFANYYICSEYFLYQKDSASYGTTQEAITEPHINQIIFVCPPEDEQIQIANYLDEKTSKVDKIISKINDQIESLKEFRKTLINDIVTGKVRVQDE